MGVFFLGGGVLKFLIFLGVLEIPVFFLLFFFFAAFFFFFFFFWGKGGGGVNGRCWVRAYV